MDRPTPASWPPDFPRSRRASILISVRAEYAEIDWMKEDYEEGHGEWFAHTPYSETLYIGQGVEGFQSIYQVNGDFEDPVLSEVDLGTYRTYIRARKAIADYVIDHWGSYRAWEEQAEMEMAQDMADQTTGADEGAANDA